MKRILTIMAALLTAILGACDSEAPPSTETAAITLTADRQSIFSNGVDQVRFTVTLNGTQDVTAGSRIIYSGGSTLPDAVFSTAEVGEYRFIATYEHGGATLTSNEIAVAATYEKDPDFDPARNIKKNVAFFIITGTWCEPCWPHKVNVKTVAQGCDGRLLSLNLHLSADDVIGGHPSMMLNDILNDLNSDGRFGTSTGIPVTFVDFRKKYPGTMSESTVRGVYDDYIDNPVKTGISLTSEITAGKIGVTVTVGTRVDGDYRLGIFLVEDHVIAKQTGYGSNYDHTDVARQMGTESMFGGSIGKMSAGKTIERKFSFGLLPKYNVGNLHILVYTISMENGKPVIDNSRKVPVGGDSGYDYIY